jgi:signal transduction histidine kinase
VLLEKINALKPDERVVVKTTVGDEPLQLSIQQKQIFLQEKRVRIILIQNLHSELEAQELEAWQQLIRVLTHEIMNSVTPIVSLSGAMKSILSLANGEMKQHNLITADNIEDLTSSVQTIESRSRGLMKFVSAYKTYSKPVDLKLERFEVVGFIQRVVELISPDLEQHKISLQWNLQHASLLAKGDVPLLEQVMINLLKNAIDAVPSDGSGKITIGVLKKTNDRIHISIADNGAGIDPDTLTKIFIPFYTTKSKGSGIGLSFSKQIMKLHSGNIQVSTSLQKGSTFTVELPST